MYDSSIENKKLMKRRNDNMANNFEYYAPTKAYFGKGEEKNVGRKLSQEDMIRIYKNAR